MQKISKRLLAFALALCMCAGLLPMGAAAADVYVAESTMQETAVIDQNFDDTAVFTTASSGWVGTQGTTVGRWGGFVANGTAIADSASFSAKQSAVVYRGSNALSLNLSDSERAVLSKADYEMHFMLYFNGTDKELGFISNGAGTSEANFYVTKTGLIRMKGSDGASVDGVTIPLKQWVKIVLNVDRDTGTYSVSYATDVGTSAEKMHSSESVATLNKEGNIGRIDFSGANLTGSITNGAVGYIDDVKLTMFSQKEVLEKAYTGDIIDQNFDDTAVFSAGQAANAGTAGTTVGRWGGFNGSTTIFNSVCYSAGQSAGVYRSSTGSVDLNVNLSAANETALLAGDYEMSYMLYFNGVNKELSFASDSNGTSEITYYIAKNGEIYLKGADGANIKNGLSVPTGQWIKIVMDVNRSTGTYSVSYVTGVGTANEKVYSSNTVATLNKNGSSQLMNFSAANLTGSITEGLAYYLDDVKVRTVEKCRKSVYEDVLKQDFEDTTLFNAENADQYVGTIGSLAGRWNVGNGSINPNTEHFYGDSVEGAAGQSMALERGGKASLTVNLGTAITKDKDFKVSFKAYRPNTMGFTFTMSEVSFHAVNNGQLKISNKSSGYDDYTSFSFPADQWVDVSIVSDRAAGNYTITLTAEDGTVVGTATSALYADGSAATLTFNSQGSSDSTLATPYNAAYIDNVLLQAEAEMYATLEEALAAAEAGDTVKLTSDVSVKQAVVSAGVTLDLNGYDLSVNSLVSFGNVIDSSNAAGSLNAGSLLLDDANTQLPLYDEAAGGYRFFTYGIKTMEVREETGAVVFGFGMTFANKDAYGLMDGLDAQVSMAWDGMEGEAKTFAFSTELIEKYAELVEKYPALTAAMMLTVTGTETLEGGTALQVTPVIAADSGVSQTGAVMDYTTPAAE